MKHTPAIERAIKKVALLHHGQTRKGELDLPYVTHLFSVATILSEHTDDEDVIVAGLLHDTLEDTDYTAEELGREFGPRVREIVEHVSIPAVVAGTETEWGKDRSVYIEQLRSGPKESAMVSAADKIHNFRSSMHEYEGDPTRFWEDLGGTFESRVLVYSTIVEIITEKLGADHPLTKMLVEEYTAYQRFLSQ